MTTASGPRRSLLLTDYAGHPFTYELAADLADGGECVDYSYCASAVAPRGDLGRDTPVGVHAVGAGRVFEKYHLSRRLLSEVRYGVGTARVMWRVRPAVHVVCNMPLVALLVVWMLTFPLRCRLVIWLQDVQSGLAGSVLCQRHPVVGLLHRLEGFLIRRADRVIAISDQLAAVAIRFGARNDRVSVLENWAPVEHLPLRPKSNSWSQAHGLADQTVLLYSGTLARKHTPGVLLDLADAVAAVGALVVVVSEGEGVEWIRKQQHLHARPNIVLLPYQPFSMLAEVFASAEVLLVLLDADASSYSVPSKTLAYLCSGRPILGSIPIRNAAAQLIGDKAHAGVVVEPTEVERFVGEAGRLLDNPGIRRAMGDAGRLYAEQNFGREIVVPQFCHAVRLPRGGVPD